MARGYPPPPAPDQTGVSGWARGYPPPPPSDQVRVSKLAHGYPTPPSFLEPYLTAPRQYLFLLDGGYGRYDYWAPIMDHTEGFVP